jgi:GDPmannose 4,6-dehydratase
MKNNKTIYHFVVDQSGSMSGSEAATIEGFWSGEGIYEKYIEKNTNKTLLIINKNFYRPAEVELLLGDSSKARKELGWKPKTSFKELVDKMIKWDILEHGQG